MRKVLFFLTFILGISAFAQVPSIQTNQDTITTSKEKKISPFASGFYPIGFF